LTGRAKLRDVASPAPAVVASLDAVARDACRMRADRPFLFANLKTGDGSVEVSDSVERMGGMRHSGGGARSRGRSDVLT
jgi:hypothetical protein